MNIVVLQGVLSRPARRRRLPSGDELVVLEVTTRSGDGPADSVPVVWIGAPASVDVLTAGDAVTVSGRVRRRWFRTAAGAQSRTEVVADTVVPTADRRRVRRVLARAGEHVRD